MYQCLIFSTWMEAWDDLVPDTLNSASPTTSLVMELRVASLRHGDDAIPPQMLQCDGSDALCKRLYHSHDRSNATY